MEEIQMKKWIALLLAMLMVVGLVACGGEDNKDNEGDKTIKVGIVLSTGGLGDKNFNDMAYEGATKGLEELGVKFDYLEPETASDFLPFLRQMAEAGEYALIIGLGSDMGEALDEVSKDFPDIKFSHIDSNLKSDIASCVSTKWPEQTFLSGVVAGLSTKSNKIGVIVGLETPALMDGVAGFTAGAKYVNPACEVLFGNVESFADPTKGKEMAMSMYNQGADYIQSIAGGSGMGIYTAAQESGNFSFGVGANVNYLYPDSIVATSARKVDEMVYNEIKAVVDGTWAPGSHVTGMKEGAVGIDFSQSNVVLGEGVMDAVKAIEERIIKGELVLPGAQDDMDAWVKANQYK